MAHKPGLSFWRGRPYPKQGPLQPGDPGIHQPNVIAFDKVPMKMSVSEKNSKINEIKRVLGERHTLICMNHIHYIQEPPCELPLQFNPNFQRYLLSTHPKIPQLPLGAWVSGVLGRPIFFGDSLGSFIAFERSQRGAQGRGLGLAGQQAVLTRRMPRSIVTASSAEGAGRARRPRASRARASGPPLKQPSSTSEVPEI